MKRFAFISGTLCSTLFLLGSLFKIMHWPGANVLLTLGLAGAALIAVPFISAYLYGRNRQSDKV